MNALKKIPFYLPLLAVFFCLHGTNENYGAVFFKEIFLCGISVLIAILIFFAVLYLFTRKFTPAALVSFFFCLWFFFFGALHDFIRSVSFLHIFTRYIVIVPLLIVATIAFGVFVYKKTALYSRLTLYLNLLLIIYCVLDLGGITYKAVTTRPKPPTIPFNYAAVQQKPDVYLLLFDEYPGIRSLQDSFGFSNHELYDFLRADSFDIIPSVSNYNLTEFSMPSFFNMQYIPEPYPKGDIPQKVFEERHNEINNGAIFSIFKKMGYTIENNSIFDVNDMPGLFNENSFILGHSFLLTDKIFLNRFNREAGASLPDILKKNIPFLTSMNSETHREDNRKVEKKLLSSAADSKRKQPLFGYFHFLLPHSPYYFDSLGNYLPKKFYDDPAEVIDRQLFISYVKYTNTVAKKLITALHNEKPGAIIIFMSDHGFRSYRFDNRGPVQPANFDNIFTVYFPDHRYGADKDTISNVNFFRYIFNNQFGQHFKYLPDSSINLF